MDRVFKVPFECGFGVYEITATPRYILSVFFVGVGSSDNFHTFESLQKENYPSHLVTCFKELSLYFEGKIQSFESTKHIFLEGTDFQIKVWKKMMEIPFGSTVSYSELAAMVGNEKACRSIGTICGKNPCGILIPCHRVVGKESIGGFRGGIELKKFLLEFEEKVSGRQKCLKR